MDPPSASTDLRRLVASLSAEQRFVLRGLLSAPGCAPDLLAVLPQELRTAVFARLDAPALARCEAVCRRWRAMVGGDAWAALLDREHPGRRPAVGMSAEERKRRAVAAHLTENRWRQGNPRRQLQLRHSRTAPAAVALLSFADLGIQLKPIGSPSSTPPGSPVIPRSPVFRGSPIVDSTTAVSASTAIPALNGYVVLQATRDGELRADPVAFPADAASPLVAGTFPAPGITCLDAAPVPASCTLWTGRQPRAVVAAGRANGTLSLFGLASTSRGPRLFHLAGAGAEHGLVEPVLHTRAVERVLLLPGAASAITLGRDGALCLSNFSAPSSAPTVKRWSFPPDEDGDPDLARYSLAAFPGLDLLLALRISGGRTLAVFLSLSSFPRILDLPPFPPLFSPALLAADPDRNLLYAYSPPDLTAWRLCPPSPPTLLHTWPIAALFPSHPPLSLRPLPDRCLLWSPRALLWVSSTAHGSVHLGEGVLISGGDAACGGDEEGWAAAAAAEVPGRGAALVVEMAP